MKYVRTSEDTIVEISEKSQFYTYDNERIVLEKGKRGMEMIRGFVRKVADNIEELCDEFVCDFGENKIKLHAYSLSIAKKTKALNVYGAIWTDKGLIYVAKMNDKGELELL